MKKLKNRNDKKRKNTITILKKIEKIRKNSKKRIKKIGKIRKNMKINEMII